MMGGLFKSPKAPKPPVPVAMPDPEDPKLKDAARRRRAEQAASSGRRGNMLTDAMRTLTGSLGRLGK